MRKLKPYMACIIISDSVTTWTVAHQVPLSMGCPTQEYWSEWPVSPPGDLPYEGWEHCPLCLLHGQENFLPLESLRIYKPVLVSFSADYQTLVLSFTRYPPPPPFSSPSFVFFFFFLRNTSIMEYFIPDP